MTIRLVNKHLISPHKMELGQLGEIVQWKRDEYLGMIVVRTHDGLQALTSTSFWTRIDTLDENCRIRLLQPFETLEIIENS